MQQNCVRDYVIFTLGLYQVCTESTHIVIQELAVLFQYFMCFCICMRISAHTDTHVHIGRHLHTHKHT